ncbi:putative mitochondrial protein [Tanacetum coccineum]
MKAVHVNVMNHPPNKKDVIELMVKELLESGLSKYIMKDKFPIPVIKEIIDELNRSAMFSKQDLRSGYHQIRMSEVDICISQPLTTLLKKNAFKWNVAAELAYNQLKKAMMEAPVLVALPNFDQEFVVETYASGTGIGVVLCQSGHPIAHINKTLVAKHQSLSTYKKEFLAVVAALEKWKGYLLDKHFKIRTYHFSLKRAMKMVRSDALSRVNLSGELLQLVVISVASNVWEKVKDSLKNDIDAENLIQSLVDHSYKGNKYN